MSLENVRILFLFTLLFLVVHSNRRQNIEPEGVCSNAKDIRDTFSADSNPEIASSACCFYSKSTCCTSQQDPSVYEAVENYFNELNSIENNECYLLAVGLPCFFCSPNQAQYMPQGNIGDFPRRIVFCKDYCDDLYSKCANISPFSDFDTSDKFVFCEEVIKDLATRVVDSEVSATIRFDNVFCYNANVTEIPCDGSSCLRNGNSSIPCTIVSEDDDDDGISDTDIIIIVVCFSIGPICLFLLTLFRIFIVKDD